MLVYQVLIFRLKKKYLETPILVWCFLRLISEAVSYFLIYNFKVNTASVSLFSELLEGLFLVWYFYELNQKVKFVLLTFLIPPLYFYMEIKYSGSIHNVKGISFAAYNALSSVLMLILLLKQEKIQGFSMPIIKALFITHSVIFCYSILEDVMRHHVEIMKIVYPLFLMSNVIFNLYLSYYLWSVRKS